MPPLQSATAIAAAAVAAGSAARVVSAGFAGLLKNALAGLNGAAKSSETSDRLPVRQPVGVVTLAGLRERLSRAVQAFRAGLGEFLAQHGIDPGDGLRLQLDSRGGLRVAGEHPDAKRIESLLALRADLVESFRAIESDAQLLRAAGASPTDGAARTLELIVGGDGAEARFVGG